MYELLEQTFNAKYFERLSVSIYLRAVLSRQRVLEEQCMRTNQGEVERLE